MKNQEWKQRVEWCESGGLSRRAIADKCGMSYTALCDVAKGYTIEPRGMSAVLLYRISQRFRPRSDDLA